MMGQFVEHGFPYLLLEAFVAQTKFEVRLAKNDDPVGEGAPVVRGAFRQRDTFIDAEHVALFFCGPVLDYDKEIVDALHHPPRQAFEGTIHGSVEFGPGHGRVNPPPRTRSLTHRAGAYKGQNGGNSKQEPRDHVDESSPAKTEVENEVP